VSSGKQPWSIITLIQTSDLRPIGDRAKALHEHITTEGYVEEKVDVQAASGLVNDLLDLALEYQVSSSPKSWFDYRVTERGGIDR